LDIQKKRVPTAPSERKTVPVLLRMQPAAARTLKAAATARIMTNAEYVSELVLECERTGRGGTAGMIAAEIPLADVSRLAHALYQIPGEVKRLRGELGRQGGLIKHLVESEPAATGRLTQETAAALRSIMGTAAMTEAALAELLAQTAAIRGDLERSARRLAAR